MQVKGGEEPEEPLRSICLWYRTSKHYPQMVVHSICKSLQGKIPQLFFIINPSVLHPSVKKVCLVSVQNPSCFDVSPFALCVTLIDTKRKKKKQLLTIFYVISFHMDQPLYVKLTSWLLQESWVENCMFDLGKKCYILMRVTALLYGFIFHKLALSVKWRIMI